jgi:capsular exopolysaccharide family
LAIKNKKVLIIEGDMRHASLSQYINLPKKGISNYLNGNIDNINEIITFDETNQNLNFIPVGIIPPNPTELLFSPRLKQLIDSVRREYDYVFIDCPPVEIVADTQIIQKLADRTIFVVRAGLFERAMLAELEKYYDEKKYKNISLILNGTEGFSGKYRYGYKYGYHYGYGYGYNSDK